MTQLDFEAISFRLYERDILKEMEARYFFNESASLVNVNLVRLDFDAQLMREIDLTKAKNDVLVLI